MGQIKDRLLGDIPYATGSDTSRAAAESQKGRTKQAADQIVAYIIQHGPATCDAIEAALGFCHQSASARINGLVAAGRLHDTGERRNTRSRRPARVLGIGPGAQP